MGGRSEETNEPEDNFTPMQRAALYILGKAFRLEWPQAKIVGHRELKGFTLSECPALDMAGVRSEIEALSHRGMRKLSEITARSAPSRPTTELIKEVVNTHGDIDDDDIE